MATESKTKKCPGGCGKAAITKPVQVCKVCCRPYLTHSQIGRKSRGKGGGYENAIAKKLSKWWGEEKSFRRTPSSGGWDRNKAPGDMVLPDGFPFDIECKNCEGWELIQFLKSPEKCPISLFWNQAVDECRPGRSPWLIFTRNHQPDFVMMSAQSWSRMADHCGVFDNITGLFKYRGQDGKVLIICLLDELLDGSNSEVFHGS